MAHNPESIRLLRQIGDLSDREIDLADAALALATFEHPEADLRPYRQHLDHMVHQVRSIGPIIEVEERLAALRKVIVYQNHYQGVTLREEAEAVTNLMDVIDKKMGAPLALGILYLHIAHALGWAMTGLDLSGHFLLRLSGPDGQVVLDPFRSGQMCQIEEATDVIMDDDGMWAPSDDSETRPMDLNSEVLHPLSSREVLLRLQHVVKSRYLANKQTDAAISTLQAMILFAPRRQDLWKELGYLQADRGQLRAAIEALEVVRDLAADPLPIQQTDVLLRELRWRLN